MTATKAADRHPGSAARLAHVPLHPVRISPPPLRTADGRGLDRRRASWVELFFDLVFAGAVNQLAGALQDHPDLGTLARFAFFFVPVWWLWVQFSFYADRHESDDVSHRFIFLVVTVLCAGFAASASRAVSGDPTGFVITFAAMRGVQLLLYARARKYLPATRGLYGRGGGDAGHAVVGLDQVRGSRSTRQPAGDRLVRRGEPADSGRHRCR